MHSLIIAVSLALVPQPQEVSVTDGTVACSEETIVRAVASFEKDAALPAEGYRLSVSKDGVRIAAADATGAFYAGQTLRQLADGSGDVPCVEISDAPKFPWRGVMLDESRHFFGKATVLKLLETMAAYKLNVLHWHLTDDQGWRLPVPGYPELTRTVRPVENRRNFRDVVTGIVPPDAYTREEIREIVRRAADLHIRIVPEIDMPGHSAAVLSVEHELGCFPPQEFAGGGPADKVRNVLCPGRDAVLRFYEDVLDAVCDLFPDPVVHLGGDECDRSNWKRCAKCQARMKEHGLKDVAELQAWFTAHFCKYLAKKGRRLLGWDEIAEGGLPPSAMVMSWRGVSTGIAAAKNGQDVVMTPNEYCYFDYDPCITGDPMAYNFNWAVPLPLVKVYGFDPLKGIPAEYRSHVLGAQCNNWTEMTCLPNELEWKIWPRALALAEVLWTYPEKRDFADFVRRAEKCRERLVAAGVNAGPVRRHPAPRNGTLTRSGDRIDYVSGETRASVAIEDGDLVFTVNGKRARTFKKDGRFVELEVLEDVDGSYFVTARRDTSEIVATFRFEGEKVIAKERWDWAGSDNSPLDMQKMIDAAAAKGGGEVVVPAGRWEVKPFVLRSNVTLKLDDRSEIYASDNISDYSAAEGQRCFIFAEGATNVSIVGKGLFYGRGYRFRQLTALPGESQPQALPVMMRLSRCRDVRLEDFALCSCGAWGCHLRNCDGAVVRRVKILNHVNNTNDGIDIESSNVLIEDCDIDADDDAVCLKNESDPSFPVTNVVVRNCRLATCANAFKIGTGTYGDVRDVLVEDCAFSRPKANYGMVHYRTDPGVTNRLSGMAGIALECIDGGCVENVTVRGIAMEGYGTPVFIRAQRRHEPSAGRTAALRNILIENVTAVADSRIASSITGVPGLRPRDIAIRNVDFLMPGGGTDAEARCPVPESEKSYPDAHMFNHQALPAYGFYLRHADGVTLENVRLRLVSPDVRKDIVAEDCTEVSVANPSQVTTLRSGWEFYRDGVADWESVPVPHDWAIGGEFSETNDLQVAVIRQDGETVEHRHTGRTGGLPWPGKGYYRRKLDIPAGTEYAELVFEGAMSEPVVYADGKEVGRWMNGYNSFIVPIPPTTREIEVALNNPPASSRWYPGSGLIRPVRLVTGGRIGVATWGQTLRTPDLETLTVETELRNPENRPVAVDYRILDADGRCVARGQSPLRVKGARAWTPETPALYMLETTVREGEKVLDVRRQRFGFRTFKVTKDGFFLNGMKRPFRGVCLHHDLGPIGAAFNKSAFRRQVRLLKELGADSIRTSHNMPAPDQMDICDEEGMMVMAESFDMWMTPETPNDYSRHFRDWWRRDLENLLRCHRNHPSIVLWSIGNEIHEENGEEVRKVAKEMTDLCHRMDPTRPVVFVTDRPDQYTASGAIQETDVPALTYRLPRYGFMHEHSPIGLVLGGETASTFSSRGCYHFPDEPIVNAKHPDGQSSSYDLEHGSWSNLPDDDWAMQDDHPWAIGEFVWTGFDYLGEPTPYKEYWPSRSSYFGIFDLAGIPKDRYWLYRSRWRKDVPTLHVLPHWTWPGREGKVTPVYVYTSYPEAELFVNGVSQGRRRRDPSSRLDRYRLRWRDVIYRPGELKVIAYDAAGKAVDEKAVRTAGKPAALRIVPEQDSISVAPDLGFFRVSVVDKDGNVCPDADNRIDVAVSGAAKFKGICNGDATSLEPFVKPTMKAFHGELTVVVESGAAVGSARISVLSAGLRPADAGIMVR